MVTLHTSVRDIFRITDIWRLNYGTQGHFYPVQRPPNTQTQNYLSFSTSTALRNESPNTQNQHYFSFFNDLVTLHVLHTNRLQISLYLTFLLYPVRITVISFHDHFVPNHFVPSLGHFVPPNSQFVPRNSHFVPSVK